LSRRAERIIRTHARPAVSDLTEVELSSALSRKVRLGEMLVDDATQVLLHLEEGLFTRVQLERRHYELARDWLARFTLALRTLDALHLAVAAREEFRLVTADAAMAQAAKTLGVEGWLRLTRL
jgi:predicted nucleic acid-binding protein